ncbi:hypothetical protein [Streptomyces sp. RKAG337]|uniref:hypothetical protein n=1 Tax=Streptomyces sp. RKAG337 TaxID=2893404 RepID=UPI0020343104|nr:hypothetical protein [Streptomyces sp. RKAG337]MCM2424977.1 hypothetical protein [Streptomyces sp. RKAG337]
MDVIIFNLTTAALMVLMFRCGLALLGERPWEGRPVPWAAVTVTTVAVGAVILQQVWSGAMDALDADPAKSGWWRVVTSVFMQNGGIGGTAWNLATLAVIAAFAQWYWKWPIATALFFAGILLPSWIDGLFGEERGTDPRNFAGSSGATYFLGSTLAAALLQHAADRNQRLLALAVPALGLAMWFGQDNGHGLVSAYGFVLGLAVLLVSRRLAARVLVGSA